MGDEGRSVVSTQVSSPHCGWAVSSHSRRMCSTMCFPWLRTLNLQTCCGVCLAIRPPHLPSQLAWDLWVFCFVIPSDIYVPSKFWENEPRSRLTTASGKKHTREQKLSHALGVSPVKWGYGYTHCETQSSQSLECCGVRGSCLECKCLKSRV